MHVAFIPYGKRCQVELLLRDMEAQKFQLDMIKGKKTKSLWIQGVVRVLPFGIYEYIFPKKYRDIVLTTLKFNGIGHTCGTDGGKTFGDYSKGKKDGKPYESVIGRARFAILRKLAGVKKAKKFESKEQLLWIIQGVKIIPLGVREDVELIEGESTTYPGWRHEAL